MPNKWFSAFLAIVFPPAAFIYLSKAKWALFNLFVLVVAIFAAIYWNVSLGVVVSIYVIGFLIAAHAYKLA
jgi:hypothetical protein